MENIVEKEEDIAGHQHYLCWSPALSPFPTVISEAFTFRVVESRDCVVKG